MSIVKTATPMIFTRKFHQILVAFVLVIACASVNAAWLLPDGFSMTFNPSGGWELRWKSLDGTKVYVGGARPEFRLSGGAVFGYPIETPDGGLYLRVTSSQQEKLSTDGENLEVWSSGKRLDLGDGNSFLSNVGASSQRQYDSKPPSTPTSDVDPAAKGTYATSRLSYTLSSLPNVPNFPNPIEVLAEVTRPLLASGKRPLVLFLHGRHSTCYDPKSSFGDTTIDWPCAPGYKPIPSHKGYRYVADILASQGYITVSIAANGVNGQDGSVPDSGASARSILIRHHLTLWAKWNSGQITDPWGGAFKNKVDMKKVVLVGHSRGGEGVNRAAVDASSSSPFKIVGLVSYGPTAFGQQVTPDVHSATILPTCDGDVSDLQGQAYIDDSRDIAWSEALRSAIITIGCNHNYFNTEWTPGLSQAPSNDDWGDQIDPTCGSNVTGALRLTPQEQQIVGAAYTSALVRMAVNQDPQMLQFLDGSFVKPKSVGRAEIVVSGIGGASYRLLYRPDDNTANNNMMNFRNGMKGNVCVGYSSFLSTNNTTPVCNDGFFSSSPHWLQMYTLGSRPAPRALELSWTNRVGASAAFKVTFGNLTGFNSIDFRIANDPDQLPAKFDVLIRDTNGNNSTITTSLKAVDGWPGTGSLDRIHAHTLRGDLTSVGNQVNLNQIVAVALVARIGTGKVWLLDIAASKAKISIPIVLDLPTLSVPLNFTTPEGDGPHQTNVTITADRPFKLPASIWLQPGSGNGYQVDIPAGSRAVQVPFFYIGDKIYNPNGDFNSITIAAISGVTTGNYIGGFTVVEDDPIPILSVVSKNVVGVEGGNLAWTFRLSSPTSGISYYLNVIQPSTGKTELSSGDVDKKWLQQYIFSDLPSTPVPLSTLGVSFQLTFGYGITSVQFVIPISNDGLTEGTEMVQLQVMAYNDPTVPSSLVVTGTVNANNT